MIHVWLKIKDRGNLNQILRHLNFWLGLFSNRDKYQIWIYNEDVNLPNEYYLNYKIINRAITHQNPECFKLQKMVNRSHITDNWKPASYALAAPYFYLAEDKNQILLNLDADDITIFGAAKNYIEKTLEFLIHNQLPTLSWDFHLSKHIGQNGVARPNHWTFGVNISHISKMKQIILNCIMSEQPVMPWGINLDYLVDKYLETTTYSHISFIAPIEMVHTFGDNCRHTFFSKFLSDNNVEVSFDGHGELASKHPRTLLIT